MILTGKAAWVFPDNFDVDYIVGIPNIGLQDMEDIVHCLMKDFAPDFLTRVSKGDILVAGRNFGYGHAHPQPMAGMRRIGITCVVAESYAFPFYRSELASGMKLFTCPGVTRLAAAGERLAIDTQACTVKNLDAEKSLPMKPFTGYPLELLRAGGVAPYLQRCRERRGG